MPEAGTELAGLPPALGGAQAPGAPSGPGPAAMPLGDAPDDAAANEALDIAELGEMCGDIYADVFGVAGQFYVGKDVELPENRAKRRGHQIAVVLRKLGWGDDEILCYVGLTAGVAGDFAILHREKVKLDAERKAAEAAKAATTTTASEPAGEGASA